MSGCARTPAGNKKRASPVPWPGTHGQSSAAKTRKPSHERLPACICGCNQDALAQGLRRPAAEFLEVPKRSTKAQYPADDIEFAKLLWKRLVEEGSAKRPENHGVLRKNYEKVAAGTGGRLFVHRDHFSHAFWRPGRQEGSAEKVEYDLVIEQCLRGKGRDTNVIVPRAAAVRGLAGSARGQRATARNSVDEVEQLRQEMQRMQCAMRAREDEMDRREAEHRAEVARLEAELKLPMWGLHRMTDKKTTHALTPFPGPKSIRAFIDLLEVDGSLQATRLSANTDYNCRVRHYNGLGSTGGKVHRRTKAPRSSAGGAASAASDDSDGGDTYFGQSDIY